MAVIESKHALITHLVSRLRDSNLNPLQVRETLGEIGRFLFYEAMHDAALISKRISTWKGAIAVESLDEAQFAIVPIMRAGLPMVEAILPVMPYAVGGFMAMKRDEENFESKLYYDRIPDLTGKKVILCDPMLATGGSLDDAIKTLKEKGAKHIISLNIVASPEGIAFISSKHPDVDIYIAKIDDRIDQGYILPGIGDAGDRAFHTL